MLTASPKNSPVRRLLKPGQDSSDLDLNLPDHEEELRGRRLEAITRSNLQERPRKSAVGLNPVQLEKHSLDCLKLSTENKINPKNAFSLMLIDVMSAMVKKSDSEISKNFQVAGCTLDASVKIYGCRVDAVHTDAMKMASGFIHTQPADENPDDEAKEGNEENEPITKKKVKKRRKTTIAAPETLNTKSELEALLDTVPQPNFLSKNASDSGTNLLTRIPKFDDSCILSVDAHQTYWSPSNLPTHCSLFTGAGAPDQDSCVQLLELVDIQPSDKICHLVDVEFGKDVENDSDDNLFEMSQHSTYEYNQNVSVNEDMNVGNTSHYVPRRHPGEGYASDEEIILPPPKLRPFSPVSISHVKHKLSINPMEYSFFDEQVIKAWAGPTYWKIRPLRTVTLDENKENEWENSKRPVALKRTRKNKTKEPGDLFDINEEILDDVMKISDKTVFAKSTLSNWRETNVTLAEDYKYKTQQLFSLFSMPFYTVEPSRNVSNLEEVTNENLENDNQEHHEELDYCSQSVLQSDENDVNNSYADGEVDEWKIENMVTVPNKVEQITMVPFQKKKIVDVKVLKSCLWKQLEESNAINSSMTFTQLLEKSLITLPKKMIPGVSTQIVFNALLHLTNEKCLRLQQRSSDLDFEISLK